MLNPIYLNRWVKPFYLKILNGNYALQPGKEDEKAAFNADVKKALDRITPRIARKLINGYWRESITGSWLVGIKNLESCQELIDQKLIASETGYAGQSHAFAMACFANEFSIQSLRGYLTMYLDRVDCFYDQGWAMPALMWVDRQRQTNYADEFLVEGGLWDRFIADKVSADNQFWSLENCKKRFWQCMEYCQLHFKDETA